MAIFKKKVSVTKSLAMNGKDTGAIVGIKGFLLGQIIRMESDKAVILGSSPDRVDLFIDSKDVCGEHCSIKYIQGEKVYEVQNLSDGVLIVDVDEELNFGQKVTLSPGTRLFVGSSANEIRLG